MQIVTRFDIFDRAGNEAEGTEDRQVVRLFEKRKLLGEFDLDDVTRYDGDFDSEDFTAFLTTGKDGKPLKTGRTLTQAMDYLGSEPEGEDEDEQDEGGSIVPEKYRLLYGAAQNCGDEIALELSGFVTLPRATKKDPDGGLDRAKLRGVAETNGIGDKLAMWEDHGLNGGLLRMNTSNVLRGMNRRGERVVIGNREWPEDLSNPRHPQNKAAAKAKREAEKAAKAKGGAKPK